MKIRLTQAYFNKPDHKKFVATRSMTTRDVLEVDHFIGGDLAMVAPSELKKYSSPEYHFLFDDEGFSIGCYPFRSCNYEIVNDEPFAFWNELKRAGREVGDKPRKGYL